MTFFSLSILSQKFKVNKIAARWPAKAVAQFFTFSKKRENVLVYLSNAIQKYCIEQGFEYSGIWQKWAYYGFDKDGIQ